MRDLAHRSKRRCKDSGSSRFPEDMRQGHGYPALTDEDRAKIFGLNLAGLLGVDASKRRVK